MRGYFCCVRSGMAKSAFRAAFLENYQMPGAYLLAQMVKNFPAMQETQGSILGVGRSPGEGNGNPLQCSYLENSMDRGAWRAI